MTEPIKRVHFFDHQILRADDFTTEQDYHRAMRHLHNRALHNWGVGDGLDVSVEDPVRVAVTPGLAFDREGRELVLRDRLSLDLTPLDLPDDADCWVLAAYGERASDPTSDGGVADHTRWVEQAEISLSAVTSGDPGLALVLGRVTRRGPSAASVDVSERVEIGLPDAAELQAAFARKVDREGATAMAGPLTIDARLDAGDATVRGALSVAGATSVGGAASIAGPLSVGSSAARQRATVAGDLILERGLIIAGRADGSTATPGETLGGIGFFGMGVQHGQLTFRAGTGFELVDRSPDGPSLDYPAGQYQYADLRVRDLLASRNMIVGAGSNGVLVTRHIDGKRADNDAADPLHLNWATGFPVNVGGGKPADLHVSGGMYGDGGLLQFNNGATIRNAGRQHIFTQERLYLLSVDNVYVGREWGGAGHLIVEGSVFAGSNAGFANLPSWSGGGIVAWDLFCLGGAYGKTKSFLIDHPLDPDGSHLLHGSLEGPEHAVVYRGEGRLEDGVARVALPDYFEALTRQTGRTVILTPKTQPGTPPALVGASAVRDGGFTVHAANPAAAEQNFYWEVKAVRADVEPLTVKLPKDGRAARDSTDKGGIMSQRSVGEVAGDPSRGADLEAPSDNGAADTIDHREIKQRLQELSAELEEGHIRLRAVDAERAHLQETILRIEGAILVLREIEEKLA